MESLGAGDFKSSRPRKRNRASEACDGCRKRKVRCDIAGRNPCSHCSARNLVCQVQPFPGGSTVHGLGSPMSSPLAPIASDFSRALKGPVGAFNHALPSLEVDRDIAEVRTESGEHLQARYPEGPPFNREAISVTQRSDSSATTSLAGTVANTTRTADDEIWSRNLQEMSKTGPGVASIIDQDMSPSGLFDAQQGTFAARKCVKFSGETLAHSILLVMNGHAELTAMSRDQANPRIDRVGLQLFPAPISRRPRGKAPWINADCQTHLDLLGHLPPEDRHYLYHMKRVFSFPQRSVANQLVRVFLESVYPLFPIFDRRDLVQKFERLYDRTESSPLLFHALFFSACQYADDELLKDAGFDNMVDARTYFFQRAKILYSYDCEPDHVIVVQSLSLLSFWWMDYTEEKDMRYWVTCAINLALTMGMHKTLPKSLKMSTACRRLWRRIFWTLYSREHQVATAIGQPFLLCLKDCDLEMLSKADFEEDVEEQQDSATSTVFESLSSKQLPCHTMVALKHVELAVRFEELLVSLQDAGNHSEALAKLHSMRQIASPDDILSSSGFALDGFSIDDASSWTRDNVFVVFLHLYHERIAMFYHRKLERSLVGIRRNADERSPNYQHHDTRASDPPCNDLGIDLADARAKIVYSAERVFRLLDLLASRGLLRYAPSNVNTTIFHSFLALAEEVINTPEGLPRHDQARNTFQKGLKAVEELRKYWSAASWCYTMYSKLAENDFMTLKPAAGQAVYLSRLQSRLPSRYGTPLITDDEMPLWDVDFLDPMLCLDDAAAFAFGPFGDWRNIGSGHHISKH